MQDAARLQAAIDIIHTWMDNPRPADRLMAAYFRDRRYIGGGDKKFISHVVYTTFRHWRRAEYIWKAKDVGARKRVFAASIFSDICTYLELKEACTGERYVPNALSASEENVLDDIPENWFADAPEDVMLEIPIAAYKPLQEVFGDQLPKQMEAILIEAPVDIRINTLKSDKDAVKDALKEVDLDAEDMKMSPEGVRVHQRFPFHTIDAYREGQFEVQDEGSQILAHLCAPKPGQTVVDFCAGAGGKTLALAALMQNKGTIYACDIIERRMEELAKRCKRSGVHNVRRQLLSDENDKWVKKHKGKADVVLIDAPCSGTGTWRRNPDARWRLSKADIAEYHRIQLNILESASRLVNAGGKVVYATCSMLPQENTHTVQKFLENHPEFELVPAQDVLEGQNLINLPYAQPYLRLTPLEHGCDGFFGAVLQKKAQEPKLEAENNPEKA
jgi:16S rRNA (cytosine967-C5)-methyltransferase